MDFILKLKHWQVFIILALASVMSNFIWVGEDLITLLLNTLGTVIYFFWYFATGLELTEYLPRKVILQRTAFIINGLALLLSMFVILIFFDGHFVSNSLLAFVWVIYLIYALFQFMFYPSKALKSIELEEKASLGQYFSYFLLIIFWPVGIWWIQPKLNKIAAADN